jgi:GntR family transcriptional regulator, transcriptional repressor for pyruvate dehydrogenase complex
VLEQSLRDHRALLDALTSRDPAASAAAAEQHMQNVYRSTVAQGFAGEGT